MTILRNSFIVVTITLSWINHTYSELVELPNLQQNSSNNDKSRNDGKGQSAVSLSKETSGDKVTIFDQTVGRNETTYILPQETNNKGTLNLTASRRKRYIYLPHEEKWRDWHDVSVLPNVKQRDSRVQIPVKRRSLWSLAKSIYKAFAKNAKSVKPKPKPKEKTKPKEKGKNKENRNPERPEMPNLEVEINVYPEFHFNVNGSSEANNEEIISALETLLSHSTCGRLLHNIAGKKHTLYS